MTDELAARLLAATRRLRRTLGDPRGALAALAALQARDPRAELARLRRLPPNVRKRLVRLQARCPKGCGVLTVYAARGRYLVGPTGHGVRVSRPAGVRVKVYVPYPPRWLDDAGEATWATSCKHGRYVIGAAACSRALAAGRRDVGVADLAPVPVVP